jgi:uncharacterized protein (TIRG00374 family)
MWLDRSRIGRGVAGFAALTVAGLGTLFVFTLQGQFSEVVRNLSFGFMALAAAGTVLDLVIGALRYQIFLRRIRPGTSLWLPIKADLAARFSGAVTPSQTGGGPAQVFVFYKGGIPIPEALSFLMINFLSTLVFFLSAGGFTAWLLRDHFPQGAVSYLIQWGFLVFVVGLCFMLLGLARPEVFVRLLTAVVRRLDGRTSGLGRIAGRVGHVLLDSADRYEDTCKKFTREAPELLVMSLLLTVVLYLNKFTVAWFVMCGLGIHGDFGTTLAVQALLHFILYVAPTPGGSGIAELSTGALMAILMPTHLLGPFTLAYRFFLLYLPAAVGAVVLMRTLGSSPARRPAPVGAVATMTVAALLGVFAAPADGVAQDAGTPTRMSMVTVRPPAAEAMLTGLERTKARVLQDIMIGIAAATEADSTVAFSRAVDGGRLLVAQGPDDADAHYLLSLALGLRLETAGLRDKVRMGGETRREAETALRLDPEHAGAHHIMGRLHAATMRLGSVARFIAGRVLGADALAGASWDQAETHFRRAQAIEPDNPRHPMELGMLYMDTDRPELAAVALRRASSVELGASADSAAVLRARVLLESLAAG